MPIPSWTRSRNGSSSVALSRNVGPAGDGRSVGNNRPRSWMAYGRRCAVAGPTVQRTGSRSFPIASASSVSRAVVVVRHAKRCSDTGIPLDRPGHRASQPNRVSDTSTEDPASSTSSRSIRRGEFHPPGRSRTPSKSTKRELSLDCQDRFGTRSRR